MTRASTNQLKLARMASCKIDFLCTLILRLKKHNWAQTAKQSVFFSKSVKKSVKRGVRGLRAREALRACETREKKPTVCFSYNEFVPTRGFKNVVELSKICSQLRPLCEFDTPGDWFRGRIARVIVCTLLRILTL